MMVPTKSSSSLGISKLSVVIVVGVVLVIVGYLFLRKSPADEQAVSTLSNSLNTPTLDKVLPDTVSPPASPSSAPSVLPEAVKLPGVYSVTHTLASGQKTFVKLQLNQDGSAVLSSQPQGSTTIENNQGIWTVEPSGVIVVTLDKNNGVIVDRPQVLSFRQQADKLVAARYEQEFWGADGFTLERQ